MNLFKWSYSQFLFSWNIVLNLLKILSNISWTGDDALIGASQINVIILFSCQSCIAKRLWRKNNCITIAWSTDLLSTCCPPKTKEHNWQIINMTVMPFCYGLAACTWQVCALSSQIALLPNQYRLWRKVHLQGNCCTSNQIEHILSAISKVSTLFCFFFR